MKTKCIGLLVLVFLLLGTSVASAQCGSYGYGGYYAPAYYPSYYAYPSYPTYYSQPTYYTYPSCEPTTYYTAPASTYKTKTSSPKVVVPSTKDESTVPTPVPDKEESKIDYPGTIYSKDWIVIKQPSGKFLKAPVVNGYMPEIDPENGITVFRYGLKVPYSGKYKASYEAKGYVEYTVRTYSAESALAAQTKYGGPPKVTETREYSPSAVANK